MKQKALLVFLCAILSSAPFTFAADLYRCGSTFQDTPCKNTTNNQALKKSPALVNKEVAASGSSTTTATTIDSDCKQRGEAAKKIMWMREVGKTADDQIAEPPAGASAGLIRDVYNHRGSSLEVKNAIEQECMQQKEKDKLAAQMMVEAERLRSGGIGPSDINNKNKTVVNETKAENEAPQQVAQTTDYKLERCNYIKTNLEKIASKRRAGGSGQYMESLRHQQSDLEQEYKTKGC
jgi:hypothetical protein